VISPTAQTPLADNTQHSQQTYILAPSGIRTRNFSKGAAVDPRLRPPGHWERRTLTLLDRYVSSRIVILLNAMFVFLVSLETKRLSVNYTGCV